MHKLFIVTALLFFLASATGCDSCLFRGAKAPTYPQCTPMVEPGCGCAPAGGCPGGCSTCAPTMGVTTNMPGPGT
jgi:hypothetical protein